MRLPLDLASLLRPSPRSIFWAETSHAAIMHRLQHCDFVARLIVRSNVEQLEEAEIDAHYQDLETRVRQLGGAPVYLARQYFPRRKTLAGGKKVFQIGDCYLESELEGKNYSSRSIRVDIFGEQSVAAEAILEALQPWARPAPPMETTSHVYTIVSTSTGFSIRSLGQTELPLEPGNYIEPALKSYFHMLECLSSATPCGRFCLLDGPPGTGKSYLIRSLISTLDAVFILIPTTMLGSISGPALLPLFTSLKRDDKPVVLILEDADMALVSRKVSRSSSGALAEMLNLSDGLVGEMLDLRIVATTNAERIELDPAIMRPGRMCTHLTLGELPPEQLASIYNRLTESQDGEDVVRKAQAKTLAEAYRLARDADWAPEEAQASASGVYL